MTFRVEAPAFSPLWLWLPLCGIGSIPGPGMSTYCLCGKKRKKNTHTHKPPNKIEAEINFATHILKKWGKPF